MWPPWGGDFEGGNAADGRDINGSEQEERSASPSLCSLEGVIGFAPAVAPAVNCILMSRSALKLEIQKS